MSSRIAKLAVVSCALLAFVALRVWGLTDQCLWFDEIYSVHAAEHSWSELFPFVAADLVHTPLFYVLLKIWIAIGGESLLWIRSLSVGLAVLSLVPLFLIVTHELKVKDKVSAFSVSLLLLAVNGSLLKYGQEVRMYSLLLCLGLFSVWLLLRYVRTGRSLLVLTLINALLVYTHYFGWFTVAAEFVAVLIYRPEFRARFTISVSAVFALFVPWMIAVLGGASGGEGLSQNIGWQIKPAIGDLGRFALALTEPLYYQSSSLDKASNYLVSIPALLVILSVLAGAAYYSRTDKKETDIQIRILWILALLPIAAAFVLSWILSHSIWGIRHLIVSIALFGIGTGVGFSTLSSKALRLGLGSAFFVILVFAIGLRLATPIRSMAWCRVEELCSKLPDSDTARTIYAAEDLMAYQLWFANRKGKTVTVVKLTGSSDAAEDKAYFIPRGFDDIQTRDLSSLVENEIAVVVRSPDRSESRLIGDLKQSGYRVVEIDSAPAYGETVSMYRLAR